MLGQRRLPRARVEWTPYAFLAPTLISLTLITLVPIGFGVWTSLLSGAIGSGPGAASAGSGPVGPGLHHYAALISNPAFWHSAYVSVVFTVASVAGTYLVGLAAALLLHQRFPGNALIGSALLVPWAMPLVVTAMVWGWLFDYQYGLANYVAVQVGLGRNLGWLTNVRLALWLVIAVQVWKLFPLAMVSLLAGLKAIPEELFEAAKVDGAGRLATFRSVTLPGLRPVTTALILLLAIWAFGRAFTVIFVMTGGGPARATEVLVVRTYLEAFRFFDLNRASALGTIILLVSSVFTVLYLARQGRES